QNEALKVRIVDLARARALIGQWRRDYNEVRPHGSPGRIPPADFAAPHRPNPSDAAQTATTNSSCNHGLC
ncbi:MAG: transposase, partial [Betaproteobacteria bacterium]|nr:transposase [Betaproteobacteria bacterium]